MRFTPFYGKTDRHGRFLTIFVVPDGYARCWRCKEVKPLEAFRKASSKPNGHQSRCKKCENRLQFERRKLCQ